MLYRVVDAAEGSRAELKKAAIATIDAADKLHMVARRTINEMGLVNDAQAARERNATRSVTELSAEVRALAEKVQMQATGAGTGSGGGRSAPVPAGRPWLLRAIRP